MFAIFVILHLLSASVLIFVVLLQSGKAGDLASTFGGATSQSAFGARGAATMLTKATTVCAVTFMFTSLGLSILLSRQGSGTVMDEVPAASSGVTQEAPAGTGSSSEAPADTGPTATETEDTSGAKDNP